MEQTMTKEVSSVRSP